MLVEACYTTILIIISEAHSKKPKGFFRLKTIEDQTRYPEELRPLIIHDSISTNLENKKLLQKQLRYFHCFVFQVKNPDELLVFRAYILLIQAILNLQIGAVGPIENRTHCTVIIYSWRIHVITRKLKTMLLMIAFRTS